MSKKLKLKLSYTHIIALSFLGIIAFGTFLLCLPISSREGQWTPIIDSAFTAVSATCVTGLITVNTYTHWSLFGQIVVLSMIQLGGLSLMTVMTLIAIALKKRISLHERRLLMQAAGNTHLSGTVKLLKKVALCTFAFEGAGTVILSLWFCLKYGMGGEGIYLALFHSVSAFCNAGFDLMGKFGQSSLTAYVDDPVVNLTIMTLIVAGGIGFLVWSDIFRHKHHFKKYELHTKIVLVTTAVLIFVPAIIFCFVEADHAFVGLNTGERILASLFQSVTLRTAGFNSVDQTALSETGSILSIILMIIGGSPGSCAGGMKTTTFAVVVIGAVCAARNESGVVMFKKKLPQDVVRTASAIACIYVLAVAMSSMIICAIEPYTMREILFETSSAIGTVGISMGVTGSLGIIAKIILMLLMYSGRIGGLSLVVILAQKRNSAPIERPTENILIG